MKYTMVAKDKPADDRNPSGFSGPCTNRILNGQEGVTEGWGGLIGWGRDFGLRLITRNTYREIKTSLEVRPKRTGTLYGAHTHTAHTLTTPAGPAGRSLWILGAHTLPLYVSYNNIYNTRVRCCTYRCVSNRVRNESFCGGFSQCELRTVAAPVFVGWGPAITHCSHTSQNIIYTSHINIYIVMPVRFWLKFCRPRLSSQKGCTARQAHCARTALDHGHVMSARMKV